MWIQFESIYTMDAAFARYREIILLIITSTFFVKFRPSETNKVNRKYKNQGIVPDDCFLFILGFIDQINYWKDFLSFELSHKSDRDKRTLVKDYQSSFVLMWYGLFGKYTGFKKSDKQILALELSEAFLTYVKEGDMTDCIKIYAKYLPIQFKLDTEKSPAFLRREKEKEEARIAEETARSAKETARVAAETARVAEKTAMNAEILENAKLFVKEKINEFLNRKKVGTWANIVLMPPEFYVRLRLCSYEEEYYFETVWKSQSP